jgi:drug/metabolite transporter (DMT)-like permease
MSPGIPYALGAMLFYGLSDLVYKRAAGSGVPARHFLMVQTWCFTPAIVAYGLVGGTLQFATASLWGAVAGVFAFTGFYQFARSLQDGAVSVQVPVYRLSFVVTTALAILLLGETATVGKLAGAGLALVAVWLLLGRSGSPGAIPPGSRVRLLRVVVATLLVGVANLAYKVGLQGGATPASLLVMQAAVFVSLSTATVGVIDHAIRPPAATWRHAAASATVLVFAFVCLLESLARGEASVMVPIAQMGFAVTAVLGFTVLREPFSLRKGAGLAAAIGALASLSLG